MDRTERHAVAQGCHAAWLDTFQAKAFYEACGYTTFGALQAYPADQARYFLRKCLNAPTLGPDTGQDGPGWSTAPGLADQDAAPDPARTNRRAPSSSPDDRLATTAPAPRLPRLHRPAPSRPARRQTGRRVPGGEHRALGHRPHHAPPGADPTPGRQRHPRPPQLGLAR